MSCLRNSRASRVQKDWISLYKGREYSAPSQKGTSYRKKTSYLIVDGYNLIFAWDELAELGREDIGAARQRVKDILSNYRGYTKCELVLVFDGYKVKGNT